MIIVPMKPEHITEIKVQKKQLEIIGCFSIPYAMELMALGPAFAGLRGNEVVGCGGVAKLWEGRYMLWSILSESAGPHMLAIIRATKRLLRTQTGRVEAVVRSDFTEAHRLVKMCGLRWHHHEEKFLPGGLDADIYVRFC